MVLQKSQVLLIAGMMFAMAAGMVLGLTTGLIGGPREAQAQVPDGHRVFELCKVWRLNGEVDDPRPFTFNVSDISQTIQNPTTPIVISGVVEDGEAACVELAAAPGIINIEEVIPDGFDDPEWQSDSEQLQPGAFASFVLSTFGGCNDQLTFAQVREALISVVTPGAPTSCTITFYNEELDEPPPVTTTPVTPSVTITSTPTIVVCVICNRTVTPPPATSTPTTPATVTATNPPSTQPPATATATTVATQAPGLTDAQRTATAVAAARTAAAQATPIAPRTGGGAMGGAGGTLNIALLAAGLIVLSSGLSLVAVRGRR